MLRTGHVDTDMPPPRLGLCAPIAMRSTASALAFLAMWTGLRPTPSSSSRGSLHKWDNFQTSRQGLAAYMEVGPLPGRILCPVVSGTMGQGVHVHSCRRQNDNIWLQYSGAFDAQVKEVRRVPMHLSEGLVPLKSTCTQLRQWVFSLPSIRCRVPLLPTTPTLQIPVPGMRVGVFRG